MIFVKIPGIGDSAIRTEGYDDGKWFVADSFSFGVEREMKESGEKGGTADINIGVGELGSVHLVKQLDRASTKIAQFAINGNSPGKAEINMVAMMGDGQPVCYLKYKLDRCFIKSWSTSGDADDRPTEEVAFYYNKIAFNYAYTDDGRSYSSSSPMTWDNIRNRSWAGNGIGKPGKNGFK